MLKENTIMVNQKVSVIIPFFNASSSISISLQSVLAQSYRSIEVILVNDCSTDHSLMIANNFKDQFSKNGIDCTLHNHRVNRGVAAARNSGLNLATGEFVYFLDADDWIEPDTIELLITKAIETSSEIVGCNWYLSFHKNERGMNQPDFSTPWEAIYLILCGRMRWNLWLFLVKKTLFSENDVWFVPDKNMGEDLLMMIKLFVRADQVSYLDRRLYHYGQDNDESLTKIFSDKHIKDITYNINAVENELFNSEYKDQIKNEIYYLKLHIKLPLLISGTSKNYKRWLHWFPESHSYISENKIMSLRIRVLQKAAVKKYFWVIKLYNIFVVRILYGFIYR